MRINSFQPLLPSSDHTADKLTCSHFDAYNPPQLAQLLATNPESFMSVMRPDLAARTSGGSPETLARLAKGTLHRLQTSKYLVRPTSPGLYLYRIETYCKATLCVTHVQTGVVCTVRVAEYDNGRILRHELTRPEKEESCVEQTDLVNANVGGPVLLTYNDVSTIDKLIETILHSVKSPMLTVLDRESETHKSVTSHKIFQVPPQFAHALQSAFQHHVSSAYIADGHHRAATASAVAAKRGESKSAVMCAAFFPKSQLRLLSFSRVVSGYAATQHVLDTIFSKSSSSSRKSSSSGIQVSYLGSNPPSSVPNSSDQTLFYTRNAWYTIKLPIPGKHESDSPASRLNTAVLQKRVLDTERFSMDSHMHFVSGTVEPHELAQQVDLLVAQHGDACAFMMNAISVDEVMQVADANEIMPPKSTSFEPKLRCGFFVHTF